MRAPKIHHMIMVWAVILERGKEGIICKGMVVFLLQLLSSIMQAGQVQFVQHSLQLGPWHHRPVLVGPDLDLGAPLSLSVCCSHYWMCRWPNGLLPSMPPMG